MGIELMLVVWDTNKEWPLTGKRSRDLEGPFVADGTRSRMSASRIVIRPQTNVGNRRPRVKPEPAPDDNSQRGTR